MMYPFALNQLSFCLFDLVLYIPCSQQFFSYVGTGLSGLNKY